MELPGDILLHIHSMCDSATAASMGSALGTEGPRKWLTTDISTVEQFKWLKEHSSMKSWEWCRYVCSLMGNPLATEILDWLLDIDSSFQSCSLSDMTMAVVEAAKMGDVEVMRWLLDHKCRYIELAFYEAVKNNQVCIARFLIEERKQMPGHLTILEAGAQGDLDVLKWFIDLGCKIPESIFDICSDQTLEFLIEQVDFQQWEALPASPLGHLDFPLPSSRYETLGHPDLEFLPWP